jgi:hypothetical protein
MLNIKPNYKTMTSVTTTRIPLSQVVSKGYQCECCNNPPYSTKGNLKKHMKHHDTQPIEDNIAKEKDNASKRLHLLHLKTNDPVGYHNHLELERSRRAGNLQAFKLNNPAGYQQHLQIERTRQGVGKATPQTKLEVPASAPDVTKRVQKPASRQCTCKVPGDCYGKVFKDTKYLNVHMQNKHRQAARKIIKVQQNEVTATPIACEG